MKNALLQILVVAVLAGGVAFYGGMRYGQSRSTATMASHGSDAGFSGSRGERGMSGNRTVGGFTSGEILSRDDQSITVKMRDGGSKIVFYSETTAIGKLVKGVGSDLEVGKAVNVTGISNADGSLTAQSIQLRAEEAR